MKRKGHKGLLLLAALHLLTILIFAAPSHATYSEWVYVNDVGGIPGAWEHLEAYSTRNKRLYYFPGYDGLFHLDIFSAPARTGFSRWKEMESLPELPLGSYWGRPLAYGSYVYFSGPFRTNCVLVSKIGKNGALGPWQFTTPMPSKWYNRRSLHQTVAYRNKFYVIGGWSADGIPGYTDILMAPILADGTLGEFKQVGTLPLPSGYLNSWLCHSASISKNGNLYLVPNSNEGVVLRTRIRADGTIGAIVTQNQTDIGPACNWGANAVLVTSKNQLVVVQSENTFVFNLGKNGNIVNLDVKVPHSTWFGQRYVFESNGDVFVVAATGFPDTPITQIFRLQEASTQ